MKILIVDDEEINVEIIERYLEEEGGFTPITASDGEEGWEKLQQNPDISVVLLDRMMPKLNGIEFLERLKLDSQYKDLPVIMQTALADSKSFEEGIRAGAYYYLSKPFKRNVLLAIIYAAIQDGQYLNEITEEVHKHRQSMGLMERAFFKFKTIEEAQNLAYFIAGSYPDPERAILGLSEILINAVEHGNLGIGYTEKGRLMTEGKLIEEIKRRQRLPENIAKSVYMSFQRNDDELSIVIKDEGCGFDWQDFIEMRPSRASAPNGRGIMMAHTMSFDEMVYSDPGNEVECKTFLKKEKLRKVG